MLYRIVSALKNAQTESHDSGYNALQMLRQHNLKDKDGNESQNKNDDDDDSDKEKNLEKGESDEDRDDSLLENLIPTDNVNNTDNSKEKDSDTSELHQRQTILLSATLTNAVEKLAGLTMQKPVVVDAAKENIEAAGGNLSEVNEDFVVPQSVVQSYIVTPPKLRMVTLSAYIAARCQVCYLQQFLSNHFEYALNISIYFYLFFHFIT